MGGRRRRRLRGAASRVHFLSGSPRLVPLGQRPCTARDSACRTAAFLCPTTSPPKLSLGARARGGRASTPRHTQKFFGAPAQKRTICCCARNCCCACGMACAGSAYCGNPPAGGACFLSMVVACRARAPATTSKVSVSDPPHHAHHGSTPRAGRRPPARHGALSPGGPLHTHTNPPARTPRHAEVCLASADWLTRS